MLCARWSISIAAASLLCGCATTTVRVPVPVPCISDRPAKPAGCSPSDDSRVEYLRCALVERESLRGYVGELEAVVDACLSTSEPGLRPPAGVLLPKFGK